MREDIRKLDFREKLEGEEDEIGLKGLCQSK